MSIFFIVTVVRNDLNGIIKTRESIERLKNKNFKWCIVDGASTDGTSEYILKNCANSIIISEPDSGIYDAMNKGLALASTSGADYVVFMNAGDEFYDDNVLNLVDSVSRDGDYDIIYGNSVENYNYSVVEKHPRGFCYINYGMFACHQAMYFRASFIGGVCYDLNYKVSGDYAFVSSLYKAGAKFLYVDSPLAKFDLNGVSVRNVGVGRSENWRVQKEILGIGFIPRIANRISYIIMGFVRNKIGFVYTKLRYK